MTIELDLSDSASAEREPVDIFSATGLDAVLDLARAFLEHASADDWPRVRPAVSPVGVRAGYADNPESGRTYSHE